MKTIDRVVNNVFWHFPLSRLYAEFVNVKLNLMAINDTSYWQECKKFYNAIDFNNAVVFDIGDDVGISPLYFISRGAKKVYGFGTMPQLYFNAKYQHTHYKVTQHNIHIFINKLKHILFNNKDERMILKMDIEGAEWLFDVDFIERFNEYVIALHYPIRNSSLYKYLKNYGRYVGDTEGFEFATYRGNK